MQAERAAIPKIFQFWGAQICMEGNFMGFGTKMAKHDRT
jgi:hypothetical protein